MRELVPYHKPKKRQKAIRKIGGGRLDMYELQKYASR